MSTPQRFLFFIFVSIYVLLFSADFLYAQRYASGYIILRHKGMLKVDRFTDDSYYKSVDLSSENQIINAKISTPFMAEQKQKIAPYVKIQATIGGETELKIPLVRVKKIILVKEGVSYSTVSYHKGAMIVTLENDFSFELKDANFNTQPFANIFGIEFEDPFQKGRKVTQQIWTKDVSEICFLKIGNVKWNPSTGKFFPPDFIYDPYDGNRLEFYEKN